MFYDIYINDFYKITDETNTYNNTLTKYTKKEMTNFKGGKVNIALTENDIIKFIKTQKKSSNEKLYFGKINSSLALKMYNGINLYLKNYNFSLSLNTIKHIFNHHGKDEKERKRNQEKIIEKDFLLLPNILTNYDKISLSHIVEYNNTSFILEKQINNINYKLICYISNKKHTIEVKTFYKIKRTLPLGI